MTSLDLNELSANHKLDLKVTSEETSAEREARLQRENAAAAHELWKGTIAFGALVVAAFAIGGIATYILLNPKSQSDDRKWAGTILTSLFTGAVGFITGQKVGQSSK